MTYKKNTLIEVEWLDAAANNGWHDDDKKALVDDDGLIVVSTVGYFLRETKTSIQLSQSIAHVDRNDRAETQAIPKKVVVKIRKLRR